MTIANVFNGTTFNAGQSLNANAAASGAKTGQLERNSLFASMMNPYYSTASNQTSSVDSKDSSVDSSDSDGKTVNAYESFSYKTKSVDSAGENSIVEKVEEISESLSDFEENVVQEVAEILGTDTDQVAEAMELLGLTVFDLMNPQNLVQLTMELTGSTDACELLMQPEFMELMQAMDSAAEELMQNMEVPMEQLEEVVSRINDFLQGEEDGTLFSDILTRMETTEELTSELDVPVESDEELGEGEFLSEEEMELDTLRFFAEEDPEVDDGYEDWQDAIETEEVELEFGEADEAEMGFGEADEDGMENFLESGDKKNPFATTTSESLPGMQQIANDPTAQTVTEVLQTESSYASQDVFDIIEQIVEKIKISVNEKISSMEMQLNPEHLGKVHLQVSMDEGELNARIMAANEAVKNALETQMSMLRDHLNQAGMKINAIEVTVASHAFEKNLEQDQRQEQERDENANRNMPRRRNLNLSALDELMGLMSEEESLVAQMMRDNGNSVDLSA